ncbi:MAG: haloacid dehalogenase [Chloroflexota bacterium]|nr:haloacid dehalogenase [Chloroflexota bacterium]MDQ5864915.1 haloacid dehalogenase [Chloroflexota bacterium]
MDNRIQAVGEQVIRALETKYQARERALAGSRATIRNCAHSIRASHRGELDNARNLMGEAGGLVTSTRDDLMREHPDIYWTGYVQDAQKEYAEANIVYAVIAGEDIPTPEQLGVEPAAYLNGLGEAAGEMRRFVLDRIRHGEAERCEQVLNTMEDIYSLLVTVDFPDAITNGLRRTTDMVRGVLERTRGDVTFALQQRQLTEALARAGVENATMSMPLDGGDSESEERPTSGDRG